MSILCTGLAIIFYVIGYVDRHTHDERYVFLDLCPIRGWKMRPQFVFRGFDDPYVIRSVMSRDIDGESSADWTQNTPMLRQSTHAMQFLVIHSQLEKFSLEHISKQSQRGVAYLFCCPCVHAIRSKQ